MRLPPSNRMSYGTALDLMTGQRNKLEQEKKFHEDILDGLKTHRAYQRAPEGPGKTRYREEREKRARKARDELDSFNRHFKAQIDHAKRAGKASRNTEEQSKAREEEKLKDLRESLRRSGAEDLAELQKATREKQALRRSQGEMKALASEKGKSSSESKRSSAEKPRSSSKKEEAPPEAKKSSIEAETSSPRTKDSHRTESFQRKSTTHEGKEAADLTRPDSSKHEQKQSTPSAKKPTEETPSEEAGSKRKASLTQTSANKPQHPSLQQHSDSPELVAENAPTRPRKKPKTKSLQQLTLDARQEQQLKIREAMALIDQQREEEETMGRKQGPFYRDLPSSPRTGSGKARPSPPPRVAKVPAKAKPRAKSMPADDRGKPGPSDPPEQLGPSSLGVDAPSRHVPLRDAPSQHSRSTSDELGDRPSHPPSLDAGTGKRTGSESLSFHITSSSESEGSPEKHD